MDVICKLGKMGQHFMRVTVKVKFLCLQKVISFVTVVLAKLNVY